MQFASVHSCASDKTEKVKQAWCALFVHQLSVLVFSVNITSLLFMAAESNGVVYNAWKYWKPTEICNPLMEILEIWKFFARLMEW